jgi:hypothetical protein
MAAATEATAIQMSSARRLTRASVGGEMSAILDAGSSIARHFSRAMVWTHVGRVSRMEVVADSSTNLLQKSRRAKRVRSIDNTESAMRSNAAAAMIALGLGFLVAAAWWPAAPAVTAMALVALGATALALPRLLQLQFAPVLIMAHLIVYGSLYFLFVGAVRHGATAGAQLGWHFWQSLDVAASVGPMAWAVGSALAAIFSRKSGEDATVR